MILESIRLVNYACFKDITVEFKSRFSVIAGINGSGKTSLLKGVGEYFSFNGVTAPELENARIEMQPHNGNYRFEPQYPVSIDVAIKWKAEKDSFHTIFTRVSGVEPQSTVSGDKVTSMLAGTTYEFETFPLIAYYDASRTWQGGGWESVENIAQEKTSRKDAYRACLTASVAVNELKNWIVAKTLERLQTFAETGYAPRWDSDFDDELSLVNGAISLAVDGVRGLRYDVRQRSILVEWHRQDADSPKTSLFDNLSDGERMIVALVADIARRAVILNPQLGKEVLKQTPGIVLIDELDLHLHPQWQRRLPNALKEAFPAMQFIVTTHSPQVLSELLPDEIIILQDNAARQPEASYGMTSDQVLEVIMDTAPRPLKIEETLSSLFLSIERGSLEESRKQLDELRVLAPGIPEIASAGALIKRKEAIGR